ncbi:MAG: zinc ribbon domain-containing protein [Acidobacteria bacterium]|nr:zinc ribbon domain-containing protein [Acidobacteriota bacterium]
MQPAVPADYEPVASALVGITVFRPRREKETPPDRVTEFTCPRCGAVTTYSIAAGAVVCPHCGHRDPAAERPVGRQAAEFEFKADLVASAQTGWGTDRQEILCRNCGAQASLPPDELTYRCPFCASHKVIQRPDLQAELRPRYIIPFQLSSDACRPLVGRWLSDSWMIPGRLRRIADTSSFTPIYLPAWTFDSVTTAHWRAEVGHTQRETYTHQGRRLTRTKIVWKWESGQVRLNFDDVLIPGTKRFPPRLLSGLLPFDPRCLTPYEPRYLAGLHAQAYDVDLTQAWADARHSMRESTRAASRRQASTSRIRNFSMELDFSEESWRYILIPVFAAVYTYSGRSFQVLLNGQTGVIAGQRPVDWTKVWLVIAALLCPGLLLGLLGLLLVLLKAGAAALVIGLVLFTVGIAAAVPILLRAQGMDDV